VFSGRLRTVRFVQICGFLPLDIVAFLASVGQTNQRRRSERDAFVLTGAHRDDSDHWVRFFDRIYLTHFHDP